MSYFFKKKNPPVITATETAAATNFDANTSERLDKVEARLRQMPQYLESSETEEESADITPTVSRNVSDQLYADNKRISAYRTRKPSIERVDSTFGSPTSANAPKSLGLLLDNNKVWAAQKLVDDAHYFRRLNVSQRPNFMWIGCSDSRVPANQIVSMPPGEIFVHRNVANLVYATDNNVLSVLQYAIENLKVKHIIVCGHACCSGVRAAFGPTLAYPLEGWLTSIRSLKQAHSATLDLIEEEEDRLQYLCEANVRAQVSTLTSLPVVQAAWANNQPLSIHGLFYSMEDGILHDLGVSQSPADVVAVGDILTALKE